MLRAANLTVRYPGTTQPAVERVGMESVAGTMVAIVGPNGSGKSTLVRALIGLVAATEGLVELEGRPIAGWAPAERARRVGFLSQREEYPFAWRVEEVVAFGRYAWLAPLASLGKRDREVIDRSLQRADVGDLRHRKIDTLSGGEWQRVRIARALAQEPRILVLDEPTAALDLGHEMEIFELVRELTAEGLAAVVVTHQLNLAARFANQLILLDRGKAVAAGVPAQVMRADLLERVFGWPVDVDRVVDGVPQLVPRRRGGSHP